MDGSFLVPFTRRDCKKGLSWSTQDYKRVSGGLLDFAFGHLQTCLECLSNSQIVAQIKLQITAFFVRRSLLRRVIFYSWASTEFC